MHRTIAKFVVWILVLCHLNLIIGCYAVIRAPRDELPPEPRPPEATKYQPVIPQPPTADAIKQPTPPASLKSGAVTHSQPVDPTLAQQPRGRSLAQMTFQIDLARNAATITPVQHETSAKSAQAQATAIAQSVTGMIRVETSNFQFNPLEKIFSLDVALTNVSSTLIFTPLKVTISNLRPGPPTVTVLNADGGGNGNGAFWDYSAQIGSDAMLAASETSAARTWQFHNAAMKLFSFVVQVEGEIDTTPPELLAAANPTLVQLGQTANLYFSVSDAHEIVQRQLALNGQPVTVDANGQASFTPNSLGVYQLIGTATDIASNTSADTATFRCIPPDDQPPVVTVSAAPETVAVGDTVRLSLTATDDQNLTYQGFEIKGVHLQADANNLASYVPMEPGWQRVIGRAYDLAGNVGEAVDNLFVVPADDSPPTVVVSVMPPKVMVGHAAEIRVSANDNIGLVERKLTVSGVEVPLDTDGKASFVPTVAGLYPVVATACDRAGNRGIGQATLAAVPVLNVDLAVASLDVSEVSTDLSNETVNGKIHASIANLGGDDLVQAFALNFFEDRNCNQRFDLNTDQILGNTTVAGGLAAGDTVTVTATVFGSVRFPGNVIYALADSKFEIPETNENNNLVNSSGACAADLIPAHLSFHAPTQMLQVRIGNSGTNPVPSGVAVAFYLGDPNAGGTRLGTVHTSTALSTGCDEDLTLAWNSAQEDNYPIYVRADDNAAINECNESNNIISKEIVIDHTPPTVALTANRDTVLVGEEIILTVTAFDNAGLADTSLTIDGFEVPFTPADAVFTPPGVGIYLALAKVTDLAGNVAYASKRLVARLENANVDLAALQVQLIYAGGQALNKTAPAPAFGKAPSPKSPAAKTPTRPSTTSKTSISLLRSGPGKKAPTNRMPQQNHPPAFATSPVLTIYTDEFYHYMARADDPDGDHVSYRFEQGPWNMTVSEWDCWCAFGLVGSVRWYPTLADVGAHDVVLVAFDGKGGEARQRWTVNVLYKNQRPQVTSVPVRKAVINKFYSYQVVATDYENDPLTYSLIESPAGMTINPFSGLIAWTPTLAQTGSHSVIIAVTDSQGNTGTQDYFAIVLAQDPADYQPGPAFSGAITATLANLGTVDILAPVEVTFFEDVNYNARLDSTDHVLAATFVDSLLAGDTTQVHVTITDALTFEGNIVYTFVDSRNVLQESNEQNNLSHSGLNCRSHPPIGVYSPQAEWQFNFSRCLSLNSMPLIINANDDNGDGFVNERDIPDIIGSFDPGIIRIISGDGSGIIAESSVNFNLYSQFSSQMAAGDIDQDGVPEILIVSPPGNAPNIYGFVMLAFDIVGNQLPVKWVTRLPDRSMDWRGMEAISIADLDADGSPEIVFANTILDVSGNIIRELDPSPSLNPWIVTGGATIADLDLDGDMEIILGYAVYHHDGTLYWDTTKQFGIPSPDNGAWRLFYSAVANLDDDPYPEVIINTNLIVPDGRVVFEHDGRFKWEFHTSSTWGEATGPAVIADFDGDGEVEMPFSVTGSTAYLGLLDRNGNIEWERTLDQPGFKIAYFEFTAFDFDGDGSAEIVVNGEYKWYIFSGKNGQTLFEQSIEGNAQYRGSSRFGYPIADIDNDGHAEILVYGPAWWVGVGCGYRQFTVYGDDNNWVNTRGIWNEANYHITNVNDDGTIPQHEPRNWETFNNYRTQAIAPSQISFRKPDLTTSKVGYNQSGVQDPKLLRLDGVDDFAKVGMSDALKPANFTVEAWVKLNAIGPDHFIISYEGRWRYNGFYLRVASDGRAYLGKYQNNYYIRLHEISGTTLLSPGTWYHLAGTYDGAYMRIYVNGQLEGEMWQDFGVTYPDATGLFIGFGYDGWSEAPRFLDGVIDDVRIWNNVRSASQIQTAMSQYLTGQEKGLIGWWNFDDGAVTDQTNHSPQGTLENGAFIAPGPVPSFPVITARIGNGGGSAFRHGIDLALYDGPLNRGGRLIGTAKTSQELAPGAFTDAAFVWSRPNDGSHTFYVVIDDSGNGHGRIPECNEANNVDSLRVEVLLGDTQPPQVTVTASPSPVHAGQLITLQVAAIDNAGVATRTLSVDGVPLPLKNNQASYAPGREGEITVRATATDFAGNVGRDSLKINVLPYIDTTPPLAWVKIVHGDTVALGEEVAIAIRAFDNYALAESLTTSLEIRGLKGEIDHGGSFQVLYVPGVPGVHPIQLTVTDKAGNVSHAADTLFVTGTLDETPPRVEVLQVATASGRFRVNEPITFTVKATDDFGVVSTTATVENDARGPVTIAGGGTIEFALAPLAVGPFRVTFSAVDAAGNIGSLTAALQVEPPQATKPTVGLIVTPQIVYVQEPATLQALASPEITSLSLKINDIPVVLNPDNTATFTPTVTGEYVATLTGLDQQSQTYTATAHFKAVGPGADLIAPQVLVFATPTVVSSNEPVTITVTATDNVGVVEKTLTINGEPEALDANGQAIVRRAFGGVYTAIATAKDATGNLGMISTSFQVNAPTDHLNPVVALGQPQDYDAIRDRRAVIGTVQDAHLARWQLEYALYKENAFYAESDWILLHEGAQEVTFDTLGVFDPTLLLNGTYLIRLQAEDVQHNLAAVSVVVTATSQLKIGNFSLAFNDLSIPVSGIPITIVRTYDSRDKGVGDFGLGWRLAIKSVELREAPNRDVTVTLPDGRRVNFYFNLTQQNPVILRAVWEPEPGVYDKLEMIGDNRVLYNALTGEMVGFAERIDIPFACYEIPGYVLTTKDGTRYIIPKAVRSIEEFGDSPCGYVMEKPVYDPPALTEVRDLNNNTLTFTRDGIIHSSGKSVTFERDAMGRITRILDPMGNALRYSYDSNGDLVTFTDQMAHDTRFIYYANHHLKDILDPRGVRAIRSEYDDNGRLIATVDADGNRIEITHNLGDRTEVVRDRLGNPTIFAYDERGNVLAKTDALGNTTTFTYDANNNQLTETDALGNTTSSTYDSQGNMLSQTDPLGNTTTYTYNTHGEVLTTTDPNGSTTTNTYDDAGHLLATTDPLGFVTSNTYDAAGNLISTRDAAGNATTFAYDAAGNLIQQVDALGHATTFTYDANGNQQTQTTTRTTPGGTETVTTTNVYDQQNRLVHAIDPLGNSTFTEYNSMGQVAATVDKNGTRTAFTYDDRGNQTRVDFADGTFTATTYDVEGRRIAETDRAGRTTTFQYDAGGRLIKTIFADDAFTRTEYDEAGQMKTSYDPRGNPTTYDYDDAGRQIAITNALGSVTSFGYDARGNRVSATDARRHTTRFEYDANNRMTKTIFADNTFTETTFDALGRKIAERDQAGIVTRFRYDALGKLTAVVDALGNTTAYGYDELGNLITQTDAESRTTRFEYDKLGRQTKRILPLGQVETKTYDPAGNLKTKSDFNGNTIVYDYFLCCNRLKSKAYPDGSSVSFTYTLTGQRASVTDSRGLTSYQYDTRNRLLSRTDPNGATISYTYDVAGNRTAVIIPSGTTQYTFDALNRLSTVIDPEGGVTTYTYDEVGNKKSMAYPNGTVATYTYDALNRLTLLENKKSNGEMISSYAYTLGLAGNRTKVIEHNGRTVNYTYDALYRLVEERIIDAVNGNRTFSYVYDKVGIRLRKNDSVAGATNYTYDANDRMLTENNTTYGWDDNGNMLRKIVGADVTTYGYDYENQLVSAQVGANAISYAYDADGIRVGKNVDGTEITKYLVDENRDYAQVLEERDGSDGSLVADYFYGDDLISQDRNGTKNYYHYDGQMSTRKLSDLAESITDNYIYDAFGILLNKTGETINDYLYTGEQYDPNIGFYYLRARYYNHLLGIFISTDQFSGSIFEPMSLHKYIYVNSNPVNYIDPSGLFTLIEVMYDLAIEQNITWEYNKNVIKFGIKAERITWCMIQPGLLIAHDALLDIASGMDEPVLWEAYNIGRDTYLKGFYSLGVGAATVYFNTLFKAFCVPAIARINIANTKIEKLIKLLMPRAKLNPDIYIKIDSLRKLARRLNKTHEFFNAMVKDEGGTICKAMWVAELTVAFW